VDRIGIEVGRVTLVETVGVVAGNTPEMVVELDPPILKAVTGLAAEIVLVVTVDVTVANVSEIKRLREVHRGGRKAPQKRLEIVIRASDVGVNLATKCRHGDRLIVHGHLLAIKAPLRLCLSRLLSADGTSEIAESPYLTQWVISPYGHKGIKDDADAVRRISISVTW
jgi:hypothetical protein